MPIAALDCADNSLNDKEKMAEMGIKPKDAMDLAINTISAMTFSWGYVYTSAAILAQADLISFVHCDPHPGNLLVRKHPTKKGKPQLVSSGRRTTSGGL